MSIKIASNLKRISTRIDMHNGAVLEETTNEDAESLQKKLDERHKNLLRQK